MSSVFAPGKGRTFTLNFLGIRVLSICPNMKSPVARDVPFGHAFFLTLPVSLLLIPSFAFLLFVDHSIIFILVTVFLFPLIDHLLFFILSNFHFALFF